MRRTGPPCSPAREVLTVPQEEPGDGQQRAGAGRVPAEPGPQGPQAREDAVQEGGVLPAEHVQHQHGLHQALWRHGRLRGCVGPPPPRGRPPALTAFCRSESAFLRAPGGGKRAAWSLRPTGTYG